jgi:hypothetical protein
MHPRSLFSLAEHLERLSKDGNPLEALSGTVEYERFRPLLTKGLGYSDGTKAGRPAFDPVAMFKCTDTQPWTAQVWSFPPCSGPVGWFHRLSLPA